MPSFDVVSKVDAHELQNVIDQTNREINQRFDLKDSGASMVSEDDSLRVTAPSDFQVKQVTDIFGLKLSKRGLDLASFDFQSIEVLHGKSTQLINIHQGIGAEFARILVKKIKASKLKVQAQIQGDQVRMSGKKRDDLQAAMSLLREEQMTQPLQFENFRD